MERPKLYRGLPFDFKSLRGGLTLVVAAHALHASGADTVSQQATFFVPVAASIVAPAGVIGAVSATWVDTSPVDGTEAGRSAVGGIWVHPTSATMVMSSLVLTSADPFRTPRRLQRAEDHERVVGSASLEPLLRISEPHSGRTIEFDRRELPPGGRISLAMTYE